MSDRPDTISRAQGNAIKHAFSECSRTVPGKMEASDDGEAKMGQSNVKRREMLVRRAGKDPARETAVHVRKAAREREYMPDTISERGVERTP